MRRASPVLALTAVSTLLLSLFALFAPSRALAANILVNPGFESGLSGWTCSASANATVVSSPVHGGSGALSATPAGQDTARCGQKISVQPSSSYTLSAWVQGNYVFLGATGTGTTDPQTWAAPGSSWTRLTTSFTTGASTTSVTVYVNGWYGQGTYYADDFVLDGSSGTPDTTPPSVPGNVTVGGATSSSLTVSWSASTDNVGVTGYDVLRSGTSTPVTVTGTSYTASGLSASTTYSFQIRARDAAGNTSAYSPAASGTTSSSGGPPPPPPSSITVAPYIDITMSTPSLASAANATGQKYYELAFALGDSTGCNPAWGGTIAIDDSRIVNDVHALQAAGGQVIVATGGAAGPYLEQNCGTSDSLLAAYKKVLDTVGTNYLDVDVEASIDYNKVNTALRQLQAERGTVISYTLRIQGQDYGVDPFSVQILQDAAAKGVNVLVNPMLMDFGYSGAWGDAMVSAAQATLGQMKQIWPGKSDSDLRRMLGITPMIGKNDTGPVTTQADARQLLAWAQSNHIGRIGFWSVGRDNGGCPNGSVSPTCSGISQSAYEFTTIFKGFGG